MELFFESHHTVVYMKKKAKLRYFFFILLLLICDSQKIVYSCFNKLIPFSSFMFNTSWENGWDNVHLFILLLLFFNSFNRVL